MYAIRHEKELREGGRLREEFLACAAAAAAAAAAAY